ncbi:hypothetical protein [Kitasatospora sp. NPDC057198]|uniref:hypothetical protein n=1 Tax=Kitasatospora sp. NPDC057198 TaxID=3346046 RepID=UPI00363BB8FD
MLASFTPEIHTLLRAEAERRGISIRALIRLYVRVGIDCDTEIRAKREAALAYERDRCTCKTR